MRKGTREICGLLEKKLRQWSPTTLRLQNNRNTIELPSIDFRAQRCITSSWCIYRGGQRAEIDRKKEKKKKKEENKEENKGHRTHSLSHYYWVFFPAHHKCINNLYVAFKCAAVSWRPPPQHVVVVRPHTRTYIHTNTYIHINELECICVSSSVKSWSCAWTYKLGDTTRS